MKKSVFLCLGIIATAATAAASPLEIEFAYPDYDSAVAAPNYLRFEMRSTKLAVISSTFTGVVKQFKAEATEKNGEITGAHLSFRVKDMDTDVDGRNEKMWNTCLDAEKNPEIHVRIQEKLPRNASDITATAVLEIRGKEKRVPVHLSTRSDAGKLVVEGKAELSLKQLEIPDPSIAIASVRDRVDLSFHFESDPSAQ